MQFLPSTWAVWGIDGFGQTGPPDIMNPYDAVPSAARMLCADGAASGSARPVGRDLRLQPRHLVRERGARAGRRVRPGLSVLTGRGRLVGWWHAALRRLPARVLRRPGGSRRRHPVPGERDPRPRRAARAPGAGGRALLPVRRGQPDQPAEPRPAGRDREGLRGQRHRPPAVLGQPELGPDADRHRGGHGRRRPAPRDRVRDLGLQLLLGLPPVPGGHRAGQGSGGRAGPADRQDCGRTSTTPASWTRWPMPSGRPPSTLSRA